MQPLAIMSSFLGYTNSIANIGCSFSNNHSYYCLVWCSTDTIVLFTSSVYKISTTSGTYVTVSLGGLIRGQMYYCKAAATNASSTEYSGSVLGGVIVFFSAS